MIAIKRLAHSLALGLSVLVLMAVTFAQPVAAHAVPRSGVVEVTGYTRTPLFGSTGPVTVIAKSKQAAAIRAALAGLVRTSASDCMETVIYFKVMFLAYPSGRPTYVATEVACPTPGVVNISVDGKTTQHFKEDCALQHAVVSALPKGRAGGTRRDQFGC